jgi:F-type H+-transporting ATPase subunit O
MLSRVNTTAALRSMLKQSILYT